jgi:hypothetical protein
VLGQLLVMLIAGPNGRCDGKTGIVTIQKDHDMSEP